MSRLRSSSRSKTDQDLAMLANRRPSWTPSLSEHEDSRSSKSHSKRRTKRREENTPQSLEWGSNLLLTRRPSFAPSLDEAIQRARQLRAEPEDIPDNPNIVPLGPGLPESPEEGKGFRSSWEINVKDLVGDAVGNMSISPASRDIVLAARRGLFIIDLESPFSIPRFLPQGGTWDVADVQWNPHHSHAQYIVSTSSEKMLIWNLRLGGKTSIQHILKSHYRAITDINWHTTECDIVVSTGIDSWVWAWDIREPRKPIFGLSAFKAGGTQVKWNYQDANILASSHAEEVLIWDRRKGSLPVTQIRAHASKIYGIDWSRCCRNEIVTCSLDKTIKTWDINSTSTEPKRSIRTTYPVWRARNLPFGEGILSLPQRGETTLEMYAKSDTQALVETFEGHSDVVKEFVWRKGHQDDFQLITWSKDRTLRFWPVDSSTMEKVGYVPEVNRGRPKVPRSEMENNDTFSHPPEVDQRDYFSAFSAPFSTRSILAEIRAPPPPRPIRQSLQGFGPSSTFGQSPPASDGEHTDATPTLTSSKPIDMAAAIAAVSKSTGGTMSKAGTGAKSVAKVDQLAWLASVRVGSKRGSSSGGGSGGGESGAPSRLSSRSRPSSGPDRSQSQGEVGNGQRSGSLSRMAEDRVKEGESNQSLQDEITSVLTKLAGSKIRLEKLDLSKKRTCTLGFHCPFGTKSSVFLRVTFTFPRDYPQGIHPYGTPTVELERNPLINMSTRTTLLKRLRRIRERKRPCLEPCLRFLLFAEEWWDSEDLGNSESSSDEDRPSGKKKSREITVSLLTTTKNLTEPRTSQGAFGPNGELICFFRAAPRILRHNIRGLSEDGTNGGEETTPSQEQSSSQPAQQKASYFQSPALVADAVRRLGLAARDRTVQPIDPRQPETGMTILRAMTNLLTFPQQKARRDSDSKQNYSYVPVRRSSVFLLSTRSIAGADQKVAEDYIFMGDSLVEICERNAEVAKEHGRYDHERVFRTLKTLFRTPKNGGDKWRPLGFSSDNLAKEVITRLYTEVTKEKDIQLLAMISMLVLQTEHGHILPRSGSKKEPTPAPTSVARSGGLDYFSLGKPSNPTSPTAFAWNRIPSPPNPTPMAPSVSSSNSSRGSWSSLFNTGTMRQFMNGVQDTFKDGLLTPSEVPVTTPNIHITASKSADRLSRLPDSPSTPGRKKRTRKDSSFMSISPSIVNMSKSWNEGSNTNPPSRKTTVSFSSSGHKRPSMRFAESSHAIHEKRVVFEPEQFEESAIPLFDTNLIEQFKLNVYYYAELLFRWQMYHKRIELLKAVNKQDILPTAKTEPHRIGVQRICTRSDCKNILPSKGKACQYCGTPCSMPSCTVCRLPVKGLARTCVLCSHVTHISCWNSLEVTVPICPSGCGCFCTGSDGQFTRPSTRLGLTPPTTTLLLSSES